MHTSVQAGGMARARIRAITVRSRMVAPSADRYVKPCPARRRVIPGRSSLQ